jgi:tetratricopeptide (TPR) repeat protein
VAHRIQEALQGMDRHQDSAAWRTQGLMAVGVGLAWAMWAPWAAAQAPGTPPGQMFKDAAWQQLYQDDRAADLLRAAQQRMQAQPEDPQAVLALGLLALQGTDSAARQTALQKAEACIEKQPAAAPCHYVLGTVLGVQAMSEGMMKAARSAGTVRAALGKAQELEPAWYPARSALAEFYLLAPGIMGGSTSKAQELARSAPSPEQARLLEARILMGDRKFEAALKTLVDLPATLPPSLQEDARQWALQASIGLINGGNAATAQPTLERLAREQPGEAGPTYALGRALAEQGGHDKALKLYEQSSRLKGADRLPLAWRIGIAQQALGRNDEAKASFQRFVAANKGQKSALEDAKKRLAQLGA